MQGDLVRKGYERMASAYMTERDRLKSGKYVQKLLKLLPKEATVLDLGCGAGLPVDDLLLKAGHSVIGIDISKTMITWAKRNCPEGEYRIGDIAQIKEGEYRVEALVSFYVLFHLPRTTHEQVMRRLMGNVKKNGYLLITMGERDFEGEHTMYGEKMWSSQWGVGKNREMMHKLGLKILMDEIDHSGGEAHQVLLMQKTA